MLDRELVEHILKENIEGGRTLSSLADEYGVSSSSLSRWKKKLIREANEDAEKKRQLEVMQENRRLREELEELKKENDFLKKAAAFFAKDQD